MTPSLTISIPTFNDMYAVQELMNELHLSDIQGEHIRYLLIDDGSSDESAKVIRDISVKYPNTTAVFHERNLGFGDTIRELVTTPDTDFILFVSGDYQFRSDAVKILMSTIGKEVDYVLGIRARREDELRRKLNSVIYNLLISIISGQKVTDVNSIFLVKKEALKDIDLKSKSAFIHAEIFLKLHKNNSNCTEIKIPHHPRKFGKGSGGKLKVIIPTIRDCIKYIFKRY